MAINDIRHYLDLPYTFILRTDEEGDVVARVDELPGCVTHGKDASEALDNLREGMEAWIAERIESGQPVPEPAVEEPLPSGKWVQRVPRTLHRRLSLAAKNEGVSLNSFVTSILSEALGVARPQENSSGFEIARLHASERLETLNSWHEAYAGPLPGPESFQCIVTVQSARGKNVKLSLEDQLNLIGAGLPRNHRKITLKEIYDEDATQKFGKAC